LIGWPDLRAQIKALTVREEELLRAVIESGDLTGDQFDACLKRTTQERLDVAALKQHFSPQALKPFLRSSPCETLRIKPRNP
jgi:hypothetical protein